MKLIQRIGYYLGGFSLGLIILAFFLNGKRASCSYGPEARVLKNISTKKLVYSDDFKYDIRNGFIDSTEIRRVLKNGKINFNKSTPRQKPCGVYILESTYNNKDLSFLIENCETVATILKCNEIN